MSAETAVTGARSIHLHLLLTILASPVLGGSDDLLAESWAVGCGVHSIDPGEPEARWLVLDGFETVEESGARSGLIGQSSSLLLLVDRPRGRRLSVTARAERPTQLALRINGVDAGSRRLSRRWRNHHWRSPELRFGPNRVELLTADRRPRRAARARAAVARVALHPSRPCSRPAAGVPLLGVAGRVDLWPGWFVVAPAPAPDRPEMEIDFEGGRRSSLAVLCYSAAGGREVANLATGLSGRVREQLPPSTACGAGEKMVLWSRGPQQLSLRSVRATSSGGWTWRHGVRARAWVSTLILLLIATAGAWVGRSSPSRRIDWRDVSLVVAVAVLARAAFTAFYPYAGAAADTYEYWLRAQKLASGGADFLSDPSWHAWQSYIRPPGYFLFLAAFLGPLGLGKMAIVYAQLAISAVAAGLVYLMALPNFGRSAALAASLLFALSLESIATASRLLAEPLFMLFLLAGLAAVARLSTRPSYRMAGLAGALLGLAALVRAGPGLYSLLVGCVLVAIYGFRRGARLAGALIGALLVVVLPWCVRNSLVHGRPMGIETTSVANVLMNTPLPGFVPSADLDLSQPSGQTAYRHRLVRGNSDGRIDRQRVAILWTVLMEKAKRPAQTLGAIGAGTVALLSPQKDEYLRFILDERDSHRVAWLTYLMGGQHLVVVVLGCAGFALTIRDRRVWALACWPLVNATAIVLLFHLLARLRFTLLPVGMVFAGALIARWLGAAREE